MATIFTWKSITICVGFRTRAVEQIEIPVRVLHVVKNLNSISAKEITFKAIFSHRLFKNMYVTFRGYRRLKEGTKHMHNFLILKTMMKSEIY